MLLAFASKINGFALSILKRRFILPTVGGDPPSATRPRNGAGPEQTLTLPASGAGCAGTRLQLPS
jgi:hypothetical protein